MALKGGKPTQRATSPAAGGKKQQDQVTIADAGNAFNIQSSVLWGIYGVESGYGQNLGPSSAGALGPFQFEPDTWQQYGAGGNIMDLHDSAFAAGRYMRALLDKYQGNLNAALNAYNGNNGGSSETSYTRSVKTNAKTWKNKGGVPQIVKKAEHAVTAPLKWGEAVVNFVETILDPTAWGKLLANAIAVFLRFILKALYDYTVLPPWHWTERAVDYYWNNNLAATGPTDNSAAADRRWDRSLFTVTFWGLGYFLLWGKADSDEVALSGNKVPHTVMGRNIQSFVNAKGRKGLKKGKKEIEKATPPKPEPKASSAPIQHVRTVSAMRRRTVTVTQSGGSTTTGPRPQEEDKGRVIPADFGGPSERTGKKYSRSARRGGGSR